MLGRIDRSASARPAANRVQEQVAAPARADRQARRHRAGAAAAAGSLSPAVRRLLAEHHLEAGAVPGSGADGKITVEDVLRHVGSGATRASIPRSAPVGSAPPAGAAHGRLVPHSRMRMQIAERMVASLLHTAPHVTTRLRGGSDGRRGASGAVAGRLRATRRRAHPDGLFSGRLRRRATSRARAQQPLAS